MILLDCRVAVTMSYREKDMCLLNEVLTKCMSTKCNKAIASRSFSGFYSITSSNLNNTVPNKYIKNKINSIQTFVETRVITPDSPRNGLQEATD